MARHGLQVSLGDHGAGQWIAVFYRGRGGQERVEAAGTAQAATPWLAVQQAVREALHVRAVLLRLDVQMRSNGDADQVQ